MMTIARLAPQAGRTLQTLIAVYVLLASIFIYNFTFHGIDEEKHRPSDQPTVGDWIITAVPVIVSSAGVVLLWVRRPAGWWLSTAVDASIGALSIPLVFADFESTPFFAGDLEVHATIFLFTLFSLALMATKSSRSYFGVLSTANADAP